MLLVLELLTENLENILLFICHFVLLVLLLVGNHVLWKKTHEFFQNCLYVSLFYLQRLLNLFENELWHFY